MKKILAGLFILVTAFVLVGCNLEIITPGGKTKYTVTFTDSRETGGFEETRTKVEEGKTINFEDNKIKDLGTTNEGFILTWTHNDLDFDKATVITVDITLVAKWVEDVPEVKVDGVKFLEVVENGRKYNAVKTAVFKGEEKGTLEFNLIIGLDGKLIAHEEVTYEHTGGGFKTKAIEFLDGLIGKDIRTLTVGELELDGVAGATNTKTALLDMIIEVAEFIKEEGIIVDVIEDEEPVVDEPVIEEPVIEEPVIEEPVN